MKQFNCKHCQQTIQFGIDIKGLGEINDAIRKHEESCICNEETIIQPIAVQRLKQGKSRLLKLTGTIFSPAEYLDNLKDSASNLKTIASELSDNDMENSAGMLGDMIWDFEESLKKKYIFA